MLERYRISVPNNDERVITWINSQSNLSESIRFLIKNYLNTHNGVICDPACDDVKVKEKKERTKYRKTNSQVKQTVKTEQIIQKQETEEIVVKNPNNDGGYAFNNNVIPMDDIFGINDNGGEHE